MRRTALFLASAAFLFAPIALTPTIASAKSSGFSSTVSAPLQAPVKIEVVLSEDLAYRADNLPRKLSDRGSASGLRSGFTGNGFYGDKALSDLVEEVYEELNQDFAERGVVVSDNATTTLRVTIEDAKNNRPTFEQLSKEPSLSFESFGTGGAELSAELLDATGQPLGTMSYRWFETSIDRYGFAQANGVWSDARRAISRFSKKTAKSLS